MKRLLVPLLALGAFAAGMGVERFWLDRESPLTANSPEFEFPTSLLESSEPIPRERAGSGPNGERQPTQRPRRNLTQLLELAGEDRDEMRHHVHDFSASELTDMLAKLASSNRRDPQARALKRALFETWARLEPKKALAQVLKEKDAQLRNEVVHQAFAALTERSLAEASSAFLELPNQRTREHAADAMIHSIDPNKLPELASFLDGHAPNTGTHELYRSWVDHDPEAAASHALGAADTREAIHAVARRWAESDPASAVAWAQSLETNQLRQEALRGAVASLADSAPMEAAALVDQLPAGRQQTKLIREIANRWARGDLNSALAWAETLEPASQRNAMEELSHSWARTDPQAAGDFALTLPPSEQREHALSEVAHVWARQDSAQALEWVSSLPEQDAAPAMRGLIDTVGDLDPQSAATLVTEWGHSNSSAEAFRDLASDVAGRWSDHDPLAAAAWAESLPSEGEVQHHAVERVAEEWVDHDPMAASEWIGNLPEGRVRDIATERLVDQVVSSDPDSAYQWALSASDVGHQTEMLHHVFEQWQETDPGAAQATLNSAPITEEQRQDLSEIFNEPR